MQVQQQQQQLLTSAVDPANVIDYDLDAVVSAGLQTYLKAMAQLSQEKLT